MQGARLLHVIEGFGNNARLCASAPPKLFQYARCVKNNKGLGDV